MQLAENDDQASPGLHGTIVSTRRYNKLTPENGDKEISPDNNIIEPTLPNKLFLYYNWYFALLDRQLSQIQTIAYITRYNIQQLCM